VFALLLLMLDPVVLGCLGKGRDYRDAAEVDKPDAVISGGGRRAIANEFKLVTVCYA